MAESAVPALRPVLVLRPEPGGRRTAEAARALGLEALVVPLFEIAPLAWTPPDPARFDAVMITSANAIRHGGAALTQYRRLPLYAVGRATSDAARRLGFEDVCEGNADAAALLEAVARDGRTNVLHLCAEDRRDARVAGVTVEPVPVYEARAIDAPAGLDTALARQPVALLHSPRAAARLAALTDEAVRATIAIAAISPAAAEAAGSGWQAVAAAEAPNDAALLALARDMCETDAWNSR